MAFDQQVVIFDITAWDGSDVGLPVGTNPSGYDIVELEVELLEAAVADAAKLTIQSRALHWGCLAGATSIYTTGMVDNAVAALPSGNSGNITTGGAFASTLGASATNCRLRATLSKSSGGGQGSH